MISYYSTQTSLRRSTYLTSWTDRRSLGDLPTIRGVRNNTAIIIVAVYDHSLFYDMPTLVSGRSD